MDFFMREEAMLVVTTSTKEPVRALVGTTGSVKAQLGSAMLFIFGDRCMRTSEVTGIHSEGRLITVSTASGTKYTFG